MYFCLFRAQSLPQAQECWVALPGCGYDESSASERLSKWTLTDGTSCQQEVVALGQGARPSSKLAQRILLHLLGGSCNPLLCLGQGVCYLAVADTWVLFPSASYFHCRAP